MAKKKSTGDERVATIEQFLRTLFSEKPDSEYILIWTLKGKRSAWFSDIDKAVAHVIKAKGDVYVGVGTSPKSMGPAKRCPASQISTFPGLFADIDVAGPAHKSPRLPKSRGQAMAIVEALGVPPSIIVNSGHGIQAWWLFKEPWTFDDADERRRAQTLSRAWVRALSREAEAMGAGIDISVNDLARVLRIPGTTNCKLDPVPVTLVRESAVRSDPSDLEELVDWAIEQDDGRGKPGQHVESDDDELILDSGANPPFMKHDVSLENSDKYAATWARTRKDLKDLSASGYDMALACLCAIHGYTDQEIADTLIACRRKHSDDLKLRVDYYRSTINRAKKFIKQRDAQDRLEEESGKDDGPVPDDDKPSLLETLSDVLGIRVTRIVKFLSDPPTYRLETSRGKVVLGEVQNLIQQAQFRNHVAAATNVYIQGFKPPAWAVIAQKLLDVLDEESVGDDNTEEGRIGGWLGDYLSDMRPRDDADEAAIARRPFTFEGKTYVFLSSFRRWIWTTKMERVTAVSLGRMLRIVGGRPVRRHFTIRDADTTRSVWCVTPESDDDFLGDEDGE